MQKGSKSKKKAAPRKGQGKSSGRHRGDSYVDYLSDVRLSRSIIYNSPIIITIIEKDGSVSFTNPSISQVHGPSKKDIEHKSLLKNIHPDDVSHVKKMFNAVLRGPGKVDFGVFRMRLKDGSYHAFKCISKVIPDSSGRRHIVVYSSDITSQVDYEKALAESEERYRLLADTAHDMIFIVNKKGIVEYVNEASAKEFHNRPAKLIGKPLSDFFPDFIYKRQWGSLKRAFESGKPLYAPNDTVFPTGQKLLDTWLVPIKDRSGEVTAVFGVSRDVTNYKRMEDALRCRTAEAEDAKMRAQSYFDFLAHDIANLISPVLTYSETLLKTGVSDAEALDHLNKIFNQTQRTAKFIMDLRMLVEAEKCSPESSERFNLGQFFLNLQTMVSREYPDKCHMTVDLPKNAAVEVIGGVHIKNAFMQGFSNAMGSQTDACIRVNVKIRQIKVRSRQFWQVRMEMPDRPLSVGWEEKVLTPFDPARRSKGRPIDSIAFAAAIVGHFNGSMRDESIDHNDPSKGHAIVIEIPKAGTWHNTRNT